MMRLDVVNVHRWLYSAFTLTGHTQGILPEHQRTHAPHGMPPPLDVVPRTPRLLVYSAFCVCRAWTQHTAPMHGARLQGCAGHICFSKSARAN